MNIRQFADTYLAELKTVLDKLDRGKFESVVEKILAAYSENRHIFVMGNGGSGSTASHFACDINKGCCLDLEKKFKMICVNDNIPTILAIANDLSYEKVFLEQMKNFYLPGDLVIGISGSGNSENVLQAVDYAKSQGGSTIGFSGFSGGKLAQLADVALVAEVDDMQKAEDVHMILVHMIMQSVFKALHPDAQGMSC